MARVTSVAWAADGKTLFYTVEDETTKRSAPRLPPHGRDARVRRRAPLRGEGRAVRRPRRPHAQPRVPRHGELEPHDVRGARPQGGRAARGVDRRRPARAGPRVRRGPPRRPLLHPDELRRAQLPARDGARRLAGPRELEGDRPAPRRRDARGRRPLQGPHGPRGARERASALHGEELRDGRHAHRRLPRARLQRLARDEPRLGHEGLPLRLPVLRHAPVRLRLRHGRAQGRRSSRSGRSRGTTGRSTPRPASGRRPRTGRRSRSRSSGARSRRTARRARSRTDPSRRSSTATARTASRSPSRSGPTGCRSSTGASSTSSRTSAAGARWGRPGTTPGAWRRR